MKEYAVEVHEDNAKSMGRGLFAAEDIPQGAEFVTHCILVLRGDIRRKSSLNVYMFEGRHKYALIPAHGIGSLINCDREKPNLRYRATDDNKLVFTAIRDIKKGEELTIDYGYDVREQADENGIDVDEWNRLVTNKTDNEK